MEVQIEAPGGLRRQMTVRIPAERVSLAVDERLKKISARAKIPGFRPGKAPFKVIQQQYGQSARMDAVSDLVQKSYPEALGQAGVSPAGMPKIDIKVEQPGEPLEYVANFEVYPEIQLQGLDSLRIEKPVVQVGDADVDRLIGNLQKARRSLVMVERAAQAGDVAVVDFDGKLDGESFAGGKAEKAEIEIGAGQYLPDLENGLVGHAAGEQFEVSVAFPEDYRAENLRGKTAQFDITLIEVKEVQLPPVDDAEFLAAHGAESVEALREKSRTALENESAKAIRTRLKAQVLEQLLAANPLDVPTAMVEQELPRLRQEAAGRMNMQNVPPEKLAEMLPDGLFEQTAQRRVALGMLMGEVIKLKNVRLDGERVERALDDLSNDFEQPEQVKQYYHSRPDLMQGLRAAVLEDQVVEQLVEGTAVIEVPLTLEQLLNQRA